MYAGLLPLLAENNKNTSYNRSRDYEVWWTHNNVIHMAGGKLTSFHSMGKKCLQEVAKRFKDLNNTRQIRVKSAESFNMHEDYGESGKYYEEIVLADPSSNVAVSKAYSVTKAEIVFFVRHRFARHVEDILTRRTSITYAMKEFDENLVVEVARLICKESNKPFAWIEDELNRYRTHWLEYHPRFDD